MKHFLIRAIFTVLSLLFTIQAISQKKDSFKFAYRPVVAFKFAPLSLVDFTPTILFGVESRTFRHQSIHLEYGVVRDFYKRTQNGFDGFKLKTEYRFYFPRPIKVLYNAFWGPQFIWKEVNASGTATVWRNNQSYQEIMEVRINNQTHSYYLTSGCAFRFFGPFNFEVAGSIGLRRLKVSVKDIPEDAVLSGGVGNNSIFNPVRGEGTHHLFGLNLSFKIIYPIN